ncbi:hypothetical protein HK102_002673 [Quaeritorhiza haematococci]|nr:hypothetical protein HK102_002673 [Quaeritorhiza haematococci]
MMLDSQSQDSSCTTTASELINAPLFESTTTLTTSTGTSDVEIITKPDGSLIDLKDYLSFELTTEQQQLFIESAWMYLNRHKECCIDLEDAMQWMGVAKKGDQKAKLKEHFTEGIDYQVLFTDRAEINKGRGRPKETILLTPDAFKKLAQMSEGRGKEVREYFIAMERVVIKYMKMQNAFVTQQLIETQLQQQQLQTKIRLIEETSNLEKEKSREQTLLEAFDKKSVVYAGRAGEEDGFEIIKFGSTDDIKQRTRDHKRSIGDHYVVQLVVESIQNRELERQLKDDPQIIARRLKREINGRTQTELIKLDERFGINDCRDVLHRISQTLFIDKEYANMKHHEHMAEIEFKHQEVMAEIELKKQQEKTKHVQLEVKRLQLQKECLQLRLQLKRKRGGDSDSEDDSVFSRFLKEKTVTVSKEDKDAWIQPTEFYNHFRSWCEEHGYQQKDASIQNCGKSFRGMGLPIEKRSKGAQHPHRIGPKVEEVLDERLCSRLSTRIELADYPVFLKRLILIGGVLYCQVQQGVEVHRDPPADQPDNPAAMDGGVKAPLEIIVKGAHVVVPKDPVMQKQLDHRRLIVHDVLDPLGAHVRGQLGAQLQKRLNVPPLLDDIGVSGCFFEAIFDDLWHAADDKSLELQLLYAELDEMALGPCWSRVIPVQVPAMPKEVTPVLANQVLHLGPQGPLDTQCHREVAEVTSKEALIRSGTVFTLLTTHPGLISLGSYYKRDAWRPGAPGKCGAQDSSTSKPENPKEPERMFPAETLNEIGGWLGAYSDFANFAVALGVKWSPATQAQRMVRKYGRHFMPHIRIGDETDTKTPTRTKRGYIPFTNDQVRFYEYLIKRCGDVIAKEVEHHVTNLETHLDPDFDYDPFLESSWLQHVQYTLDQLEPLLRLGVRIKIPTRALHVVVWHAPVMIEVLLETGQLETLPPYRDFVPEINALLFARLLRWGLPLDLDFLLGYCVRRSNHTTPRLRMEFLMLMQHLLNHGANPKAVESVPYTREAMTMLLDAGADPDTNRWGRKVLHFARDDLWILDTWILDYTWLPRASEYRSDQSDPSSVLCKLARNQRWAAATVLLDHFGREIGLFARFVLSETSRVMYPGPNDAQAQFDFVKKMVTVFPEAVESHKVISWYSKTQWTLDLSLLQIIMRKKCRFTRSSIMLCIKDNQEHVLAEAIALGCIQDYDLFEDGPEWARRLALGS